MRWRCGSDRFSGSERPGWKVFLVRFPGSPEESTADKPLDWASVLRDSPRSLLEIA